MIFSLFPCFDSKTKAFMMSRVVKSSRLPVKLAAYLVSISQLLCLAFLYRWHFLNKTSLDWPLALTTQPSISNLSDNPGCLRCQLLCGLTVIHVLLNIPFPVAGFSDADCPFWLLFDSAGCLLLSDCCSFPVLVLSVLSGFRPFSVMLGWGTILIEEPFWVLLVSVVSFGTSIASKIPCKSEFRNNSQMSYIKSQT